MIRLIEFVHDCCMENYRLKQDPNEVFMSYEEVLNYFPEAEFYNWTPTIMGLLCSAQLLLGKYCSKEARKLVSVSSVNRLINYTNDRFKRISNLRNHE
ncbi:MAG: hypothetical protein HUJ25_07560 [Crocinitomicaceae bacterium]|nr:hypothetical protein [Crocinitomicaceae bacterium]